MPTEVLTFIEHVQRETRGGPVHKFKSSNGKTYDTFDEELASRLLQQLTKPVGIDYEETKSKDGKYTNYTIRSIGEHGAGGTEGSSEATVAPSATMSKDDYWRRREVRDQDADQRTTRCFGFREALQALIATNGDVAQAQAYLDNAELLAAIPSRYGWFGKQQ